MYARGVKRGGVKGDLLRRTFSVWFVRQPTCLQEVGWQKNAKVQEVAFSPNTVYSDFINLGCFLNQVLYKLDSHIWLVPRIHDANVVTVPNVKVNVVFMSDKREPCMCFLTKHVQVRVRNITRQDLAHPGTTIDDVMFVGRGAINKLTRQDAFDHFSQNNPLTRFTHMIEQIFNQNFGTTHHVEVFHIGFREGG